MSRQVPPHHNFTGPGFERPAVMPECPAEAVGKRLERQFVRERRAARVGWFNLAKMTGRTVHDLRRDHDAGYRPC